MGTFDYVVIGAGSAGCVLANRLSEDAGATVLLIEAGGSDLNPFIRVPAGILQIRAKHSWQYEYEPDPSSLGQSLKVRGGKVLGGSSSVNGQVWTRGAPGDFDVWARLGCDGWDYESVLPYFKRCETFSGGGDRYRGDRGPLHVGYARLQHRLTDAFIEASQQVGHRFNPDFNGERQDGISYSQVSQRRGWRHSTARAYLARARRRSNLTVTTHATVTRIVFDRDRASGVEYRGRDGRLIRVDARRSVVLSAGAIESPKLLQLSGIGDAAELRALGIDVVVDNPAVGRNLQEHPAVRLGYSVNYPTLNMSLNASGVLRGGLNFLVRGRGPATSPPTHAFLFDMLSPERELPDYELFFGPLGLSVRENPRGPEFVLGAIAPMKEPAIFVGVAVCHPESRGRVALRSASPDDPPVIDHQMLTDGDVAILIAAARRAREILAAPAFRPFVVGETAPGPQVQTDAEWEQFIRQTIGGVNHPAGTCKMGRDDDAVVDPSLAVRGVEGLRVVDASIMPTLIGGHTNAPTIMIAEKGSDLIRNA